MANKKIAVVTGASSGIGWAITEQLLAKEFHVFGISRSGKGPDLPDFSPVKFDLTRFNEYPGLLKLLPSQIDVLINDAGFGEEKLAGEVNYDDINRTFNLNFYAPVLVTSQLWDHLAPSAAVVNISSVMSIISDPGYSIYCASKSALDRYTTTLAKENPEMQVVAVMPSGTKTPMYPQGTILPEQIAAVVWDAVSKKYPSGSRVAVLNHSSRQWWQEKDTYDLVVDLG